jgi:hypothetical protein
MWQSHANGGTESVDASEDILARFPTAVFFDTSLLGYRNTI